MLIRAFKEYPCPFNSLPTEETVRERSSNLPRGFRDTAQATLGAAAPGTSDTELSTVHCPVRCALAQKDRRGGHVCHTRNTNRD